MSASFHQEWRFSHNASLNLNHFFFIEVPVASQESEHSCICVFGLSILSLSTIFLSDFGIVPTVWYFCFLKILYDVL